MGSASKRKGDAFERVVVDYLRGWFPNSARLRTPGEEADRGDVGGIPGWSIECKASTQYLELPAALRQAQLAALRSHGYKYAVVHKRPRVSDAAEQYVTLPLSLFAGVIYDYERLRARLEADVAPEATA